MTLVSSPFNHHRFNDASSCLLFYLAGMAESTFPTLSVKQLVEAFLDELPDLLIKEEDINKPTVSVYICVLGMMLNSSIMSYFTHPFFLTTSRQP